MLLIFSLVLITVAMFFYVLNAIGLYSIASKRGIEYSWIAWIPLANGYLFAHLVEHKMFKWFKGNFALFYLGMLVISIPIAATDFGMVFNILVLAIQLVVFKLIVEDYSKSVALHMVLAIVTLGISVVFSILYISGRDMIENGNLKENNSSIVEENSDIQDEEDKEVDSSDTELKDEAGVEVKEDKPSEENKPSEEKFVQMELDLNSEDEVKPKETGNPDLKKEEN